MAKFRLTINVDTDTQAHAKKVGQLLQNMADNTDKGTQSKLHAKILKAPDFFRKLMQNPFVKNFIK